MLTVDEIDEALESIRNRIAGLEKDRRLYVQKSQGVSKLRDALGKLLAEHDLTEREYLTIVSDRFVDFIKTSEPKPGDTGPRFWSDLADYFEQANGRRRKPEKGARKKSSDSMESKALVLKAGRYLNPHTGLYLQKIKRPTREFQEWINEYGAETVAGWKVN